MNDAEDLMSILETSSDFVALLGGMRQQFIGQGFTDEVAGDMVLEIIRMQRAQMEGNI